MKIFSILCVKNEADIIEECLRRAQMWSDRIFVYDGASTDGTWEKVQAMANSCIVLARRDDKVFNDGLRAEIFAQYRHEASEGDWWCRLDADEFYVDDPKVFLSTLAPIYRSVWGLVIEYYLTAADVASMPDGSAPLNASPLEYLRYYRSFYAENRFFKYRKRLSWSPADSQPRHVGLTSPKLIRFKHIPFRSPKQIQARLQQRMESKARGTNGWFHVTSSDWQTVLRKAEDLRIDARDGKYEVDWDKLPDHKGSLWKRGAKVILHGAGLLP